MSTLSKKISLYLGICLLLLMSALTTLYFLYKEPLQTAVEENSTFHYLKEFVVPKKEDKIVYGFLPYWNLNDFTIQKELTNLSYFSLTILADGSILTKNEAGEAEPGFHKLSSDQFLEIIQAAEKQDVQVEVVLSQFDNDDISQFIHDEKAHLNLFKNLDSLLLSYPVSGINIDIEYSAKVDQELRSDFIKFMRKLDWYLENKYPNVKISVDVYASSANKSEYPIWDLEALNPYVDYFIVMAYDFHSKVSTQAGPVAPLFSDERNWKKDINQYLKEFLDIIDRDKIILGIPFYGYGWQTDSLAIQANTYPKSGFTVKYQDAKELLEGGSPEKENIKTGWDENALSPYISYQEDGENYLIYYENPESLSFKMEYAKQLDLAGIAIWALGYEGNDRDLWNLIGEKL